MKTFGRALASAAIWLSSWKHLSLIAVLAWTSHAHWHLAIQLGSPTWLAPLLPIALDSYVLASFRAWETQANRGPDKIKTMDLLWAIVLDAVAVAGSHAAGQYDLTLPALQSTRALMAAALGVALVLTMWRVHALDVKSRPTATRTRPATAPSLATATVTDISTARRTVPKARQDGPTAAEATATGADVTALPTSLNGPQDGPSTATSQVSDEDLPTVPGGMTNSQAEVMAHLLGRGEVRREDLLSTLGMPEGTVKKALAWLKENGYVESIEGRRGYWRAVDMMIDNPSVVSSGPSS